MSLCGIAINGNERLTARSENPTLGESLSMVKEVTRHIKPKVECELWARAAGRCQFNGCNRIVYKSPVTQESVNGAEKAHIYSFSENGPRGWGPFKWYRNGLNDAANLMLMCHCCHETIDQEKQGERYAAPLLIKWKEEHEKRINIVTGVDPSKKSHVILYGANIGEETSVLQPEHAKWALFPEWYPAEEHPTTLSMSWEGKDENPAYWSTEETNLILSFERKIHPLIQNGCHFSIFGFAPIPLLIRLGTLFTDKISSQVYQLHREPMQTWQWADDSRNTDYLILEPESFEYPPALIISLSGKVSQERITAILGSDVSIWELCINNPSNDFLKTTVQLSDFRKVCREVMVLIAARHGNSIPLSIFPAMPVACAVDLGRIRMPKSDMPWLIYDQSNKHSSFVLALKIGGKNHG